MTQRRKEIDLATWMAGSIGFLMIAVHIAAKATRDAVFLSTFPVTDLPKMLVVSALLSLAFVVVFARAMVRWEPRRMVPLVFGLSGAVYVGIWLLMPRAPDTAAIALYLHVSAVGVILISGFWSLLNERFDPRTAKRTLGRVVAASTLGGLVGGLAAERMGAWMNVAAVPLVLGGVHIVCATLLYTFGSTVGSTQTTASGTAGDPPDPSERSSTIAVLRKTAYLRNLGLLVVLGTVTAACLDYVYKTNATARFTDSQSLMRFFSMYYLAVGVITFAVQAAFSRRALERLGLGKTTSLLPLATAVGGVGVLAVPGLASAVVARFSEAILRSSLFRSAYELYYVPIRPADKRATKTVIDVGFDRLGDVIGGILIAGALYVATTAIAINILLGCIILLSGVGLYVVQRLQQGYVQTLEQRLTGRGTEADTAALADPVTRSILMRTATDLGGLKRSQQLRDLIRTARSAAISVPSGTSNASPAAPPSAVRRADPLLDQIAALRSGDKGRIRGVLARGKGLDPALTPHVIPLLAQSELEVEVVDLLRALTPRITGQLVDALLDPQEEFIIRRRIPKALADCDAERAAEGLLRGLRDRRFEVRYRVGIALARIKSRRQTLTVPKSTVFEAVLSELDVDKSVWQDRRVLDSTGASFQSVFAHDRANSRARRSLEHVFTLLSLALDTNALRVAYRGLQTDDDMLRGIALEYLDVVLPTDVRDKLWPWIGDRGVWQPKERSADEAREELLRSTGAIDALLSEVALRLPKTDKPTSEE